MMETALAIVCIVLIGAGFSEFLMLLDLREKLQDVKRLHDRADERRHRAEMRLDKILDALDKPPFRQEEDA